MRLPAHILLCCLLVFMLCPANAQEKPQKIVLALHATPQGNAVYIEAKLNGHPATLLLDTGSTVSLCDWKLCGKAPKAASLELGFGTLTLKISAQKICPARPCKRALGFTPSWACSRWP